MWATEMSSEAVGELRRRYEPLTASVRELVDAAVRTEVDDGVARAVTSELEALVARLRSRQCATTPGITATPEGEGVTVTAEAVFIALRR